MNAGQAVAVVAGVGPGLGASLCRRLATAGYAVAGLARSEHPGKALAADILRSGQQMSAYRCDVTDRDAVGAGRFVCPVIVAKAVAVDEYMSMALQILARIGTRHGCETAMVIGIAGKCPVVGKTQCTQAQFQAKQDDQKPDQQQPCD